MTSSARPAPRVYMLLWKDIHDRNGDYEVAVPYATEQAALKAAAEWIMEWIGSGDFADVSEEMLDDLRKAHAAGNLSRVVELWQEVARDLDLDESVSYLGPSDVRANQARGRARIGSGTTLPEEERSRTGAIWIVDYEDDDEQIITWFPTQNEALEQARRWMEDVIERESLDGDPNTIPDGELLQWWVDKIVDADIHAHIGADAYQPGDELRFDR